MTEQIKSAIEEFNEIVEDIDERGESPCYFGEDDLWYLKLAIRSLQAWEEVLAELEKKDRLYLSYLNNKENPYDAEMFGRHTAVSNCIDIIKQKLAKIEDSTNLESSSKMEQVEDGGKE